MNVEKLKRLQAQVRIGGKGTPRRKKKVMHQTAATDDKKLQSSLKKLSVSTIPGIEEVNIIKDDLTVIHFNNPKAQASLSANTFAVTGHGETKKIVEMLPEILPQLGQETVVQLRMFANSMSASTNPKQGDATVGGSAANVLGSVVEEDDVPMLVSDFDEVAKMEAANVTKPQTKPKGKGKENQPQEALPADIPKDVSAVKTETINNISNEEKILKDDKKLNLNVTAETGQKPKDKPAGKDGKDAKKAKKQEKQEANKTNKDNKKASGENKKDNLNKYQSITVVEKAEYKKPETLDAQLEELPSASKDTKPSGKVPMVSQPKEAMEKQQEQPVAPKQAKKQNQEKVAVKKEQSPATLPSNEENKIKTTDGRKDQKADNEQKSLKTAVETTKSEGNPILQSLPVEAIEQKKELAAEIQGKPAELLVKLEEIKKEPEAATPKDSVVIQPKLEEVKSQAMETPKPLANLEIKEAKPSENTSAETKDAKSSEQTTTVILEVKPEQTPVAAYISNLDANQAKHQKLESTVVGSVPVDQQKPLEDKPKISEGKTSIVETKQSQSVETPTVINLEATKEKASDLVTIENVEKPSNVASAAIPLPDKPKEEIKAEKKLDLGATDKPLDKEPKNKSKEAIVKEEPKADTKIESMTIASKCAEEPKTETVVQSKETKRPETKLIIETTQQPPIPLAMTAAPEQKSEQKSGNKTPTTAASPQQKTSPPKQSANKKTPPPQDATKQQPKVSTPPSKAGNTDAKKPEGAKAKQTSPPKAQQQQQQQQQQAAKTQANVAKSQQPTTKSSPTKTPEKAMGPTTPTKTPEKALGPTSPVKTPEKPTTPTKSPEKAVVAPTTPTKSPDKAAIAPTTPTKTPDKAAVAPTTPTKSPDKATVAPTTPTKSPEKAVAAPITPTKTPDKPTTPTKSPDKAVVTPTTPTKSPEKPAIAPKPAAPSKSTTPTKTTAPAQGQSKNKADSQALPDANKKSTTAADTGAKAKQHQGAKNRPNTSGNAKAVPQPLTTTKQTTPPKAEETAVKQQAPQLASSQASSQPSSN